MIFRPSLFWDTDVKKLKPKKHSKYIIERILDFGNDTEVRWMNKNFSKQKIKKVVKTSRVLQPKTKNLWRILLFGQP
ncbi:MAG: hypothetical protein WCT11_03965 [Candidatus Magasanikbacteria bacterium]|jgi:hypothetical protein